MSRHLTNGLAAALAVILCFASLGVVTTVPAQPAFAAGLAPALA